MSKVIKGVGKVFKKVVKVVKKVAPIALGVGALVFTAGAAAGAGGIFSGGWGAAASSVTSKLGLSGTLGSVVTGAVTQAGYGAALGAVTAGVTGGNILKGAKKGATVGAITGGALGGLGLQTDLLNGIGTKSGTITGGSGSTTLGGGTATPTSSLPPAVQAAKIAGKYQLAGNLISGLGSGLASGADAKERRVRREEIANNFRTGGAGLLDDNTPIIGLGNGAPRKRTGRFINNPDTGRIEYVAAD